MPFLPEVTQRIYLYQVGVLSARKIYVPLPLWLYACVSILYRCTHDDFFSPAKQLFEISIIPRTWRGANVNLIPTKARPSITNYDAVKHFDVFSAGTQ